MPFYLNAMKKTISALLGFYITLIFLFSGNAFAQTIVEEKFNNCVIPTAWTSNITGNPNAVWGVGIPNNPNSNGTSIDGSCMVYFDDNAMPQNSAAWTAKITSPAFDASQVAGTTLILELDVHFRHAGNTDAIRVYASDANGVYQQVGIFSGENYEGGLYNQYAHASLNLSQYANPNMRIRLEYNDNGTANWWAGFDNFAVKRYSTYITENFNSCSLPTGWTNTATTGNQTWKIGTDPIWPYSMNGSCMVYFDDHALGEFAPATAMSLASPPFDGTQSAILTLETDIHFRAAGSSFMGIVLFDGNDYFALRTYTAQNYKGFNYDEFIHEALDLSPYRSPYMRIIYVFNDDNTWAWKAAVDNHRITGMGHINDSCPQAQTLTLNAPCTTFSNANAIFTGPAPSCTDSTDAGIWFKFAAPPNGMVSISTQASFNELISVFSGTCNALTQIACTNYDEHGFSDETLRLSGLSSGQNYFIRVSGVSDGFGTSEGDVCIKVNGLTAMPNPPIASNDNCATPLALNIGAVCVTCNNRNATFQAGEPTPSLNRRARASVWYSFVAPTGGKILLENRADFSCSIAVFSGTCTSLNEVACNDHGNKLRVTGLTAGQTYRVQVSAYFATSEGGLCLRAFLPPAAPANELCTNAVNVTVGAAQCTSGNNNEANFVGTPANVQVPFTGYEGNTKTDFSYQRPGEGTSCNLSNNAPTYDMFTFKVATAGSYTITNTYEAGFDGYLHLYANNFNPQNPCATYIAGNDNFNGQNQSRIVATLSENTVYYVVTSAFAYYAFGQYSTSISGAGAVTRFIANANINGQNNSCDFNPAHPVWFTFTAPTSGKVRIHTGNADFMHTIALYEGVCGDLTQHECYSNPSPCDDGLLFENLTAGKTYFLQITSTSNSAGYSTGSFCLQIKDAQIEPVRVRIKALLQGAYAGNGTMSTSLAPNYLIPTEQPYSVAPWNYNGGECINLPQANMTDWVLVELRQASNGATIVATKAALLLNNGSIIDKGKDAVYFDVPAGNYYIVVRHRNHLAVMSTNPIALPNNALYNFSSSVVMAMGNNQQAILPGGYFGLIAGDFNANGVITVADFNLYAPQSSMLNQYMSADCNLDRSVTVADFNLYTPNSSILGVAWIRY